MTFHVPVVDQQEVVEADNDLILRTLLRVENTRVVLGISPRHRPTRVPPR